MRLLRSILAALAVFVCVVSPGLAGGRVALVIGNGSYEGTTVLANPVNDAADIAVRLRDLGFTVVEGVDLGKREMEQKIGEFADLLEGAEASLVYFAGHGVSDNAGRNFLVPVDGHLDAPGKLRFESIAVDDIAELMSQQTQVSILILDACRNNPFSRAPNQAKRGAVDGSPGLASGSSYAGVYTIYSAQPGAVALDGEGRNSPFATAFLKHIGTPGVTVETMMGAVKTDVMALTQDFQEPDANGLLGRPFSFVSETVLATRSVAPSLEDAPAFTSRIADQAAIRSFIETEYLDPDVVNLETTLKRMYLDQVNAYGSFVNFSELVLVKRGFFERFSKWKLSLYPGTLSIEFPSQDEAKATFVMHYVYWEKQKPQTPAEGNYKVALEMVRSADGLWRIQSEAAIQ
ncbi:caspase domain-containing protein [Aestuariivirga sp.]|uniref:caspase family protein n=1 Tax=Aestuariivirga sp. TaxID=2650926 RepID=UPI00359476C2